MKQRRTMGVGQTICLSLVLVLIGVSMFLPVFRINGSAMSKAMNTAFDYIFDHMKGELGGQSDQEEIEEAKKEAKAELSEEGKEFEETVKEFEKKNGVKIRQISAFRIMTNSYWKLVYGKNLDAKAKANVENSKLLSNIDSKYNKLRLVLWLIYMLAFVILIITILGAILHWPKFVAASITMVYGLAATAVFAYLRFGTAGSIAKIAGNNTELLDGMGLGDLTDLVSNIGTLIKKLLPAFYSFGFLLDLILSVLLILLCLIVMVTGNRRQLSTDTWEGMPSDPFGADPFSASAAAFGTASVPDQPMMSTIGMAPSVPDMDLTATPTAPLSSVAPPPVAPAVSAPPSVAPMQPAAAPVGQVKCTMGSAVGQGFRLPADRKVVVGKSPQNANLVINHPNVSNIHCSIRYNASNNSYIVKDHSMNGTFVNGVRLQKEIPMAYPAGTVLSLADGSNQITLG